MMSSKSRVVRDDVSPLISYEDLRLPSMYVLAGRPFLHGSRKMGIFSFFLIV